MQWLLRKRFDSSTSYAVAVRSKGCWWSNEHMQVKLLPSHFFGVHLVSIALKSLCRKGQEKGSNPLYSI